ncbi:MAG: SpoIIE family protein phosphatase [Coraliomargaritaceae bacterium]
MSDKPDKEAKLLKASTERLFTILMEQSADRIYIKDRQSRFVTVSQSLAEMHGFEEPGELEGLTDFDLFSQEHAQQAFDDEKEILRTGKPLVNKIEKETWPDGSISWVTSSKAPLHLDSDESIGIIGISRDITSEFIAQKQLAKSERQLREQNVNMRADYESARKVQSVIIPGRVPENAHLAIGHLWKPMTSVGGDILSFPRNPKEHTLFYMGDVCGHGFSAAFYTVLLKYLSAHEAEVYGGQPDVFLNAINKELGSQLKDGFVTGIAGHFSRRNQNGSRTLHLSHAGHPLNLLYRAIENTLEPVPMPPGMVMGLPGGKASAPVEIEMNRYDRFYTFTDGILEAASPNEEEFGQERIIQCLREHLHRPIQEGIDAVYNAAVKHSGNGGQQDDITLLGFEVT